MHQSLSQLAMVRVKGAQPSVDKTVRKTDEVKISLQSWATLEHYLIELKSQIEQCFKIDLVGIDKPEILSYHEGHFFDWHTDGSDDDPMTRNRKVTTVVYLNGADEASGTDHYIGGELEIYAHDLIPKEEYKARSLKLSPETGLLVSFGSRVLHRVQPILKGTRYVIVAHWISQLP
ncbi:MAG: 2OG-Fe(II) oxygenase [Cyanobacteria bacterium J06635_15]